MSTSISTYYQNAQLSFAAYATLSAGMTSTDYVTALKEAGMSDAQARNFAGLTSASPGYTVLSQSVPDGTGFSATLFLDNATGQKVLAVRGTNDFTDLFVTDLLIGTLGLSNQYVSLETYYQQLVSEGKLGTNETFDVTGHSLGGFLAQSFAIDYSSKVSQVYTYNAPGFGGVVAELLSLVGVTVNNISVANITNLYAQAGPEFVSGLGTLLGTVQPVFIEDQGASIPGNHGIIPLTDSLAVYNLFATLAPAASVSAITDILKASAGVDSKSLESSLDALRTLFQQNYTNSTANGNAAITFVNDRNDFYTKLYGLQTYLKTTPFYNTTTQSFSFTVDKLTNVGAATLTTNAQTDIAYRYALYKLNPFVITNAGTLYSAINGDQSLDLYNASTRTGALTDEYLKDRASFLYNKIQANNKDNDITADATTLATTWTKYSGNPQYFEDNSNYLPYKLYLGSSSAIVTQPLSGLNQIKFGSVNNDTLTGGDLWDKLYGGDGNDTLTGGKGNDYLEGGKGTDTYLYTSGDGTDTLLDTDHLGIITYDGITLNGGKKADTQDNTYQSADKKFLYTLLGTAGSPGLLTITGPGGNIVVKDFTPGDLGINLNPSDPAPNLPAITNITIGPTGNTYSGTAAAETTGGSSGNDAIHGNGGADRLYGGPGNDTFYFNANDPAGNSYADGGPGRDVLLGWSPGNDHFIGGSNTDTQDQADLVFSGAGNDHLEGGYGNDVLVDSLGHDILDGGAGDDYLFSGAQVAYVPVPPDPTTWTITPVLDTINGVQFTNNQYLFPAPQYTGFANTNFAPTSDNKGDVLLGGAGNDYLYAGPGDDLLDAGSAEDTAADTNVLFAGLGNDVLMGGAGRDWLLGTDGKDILVSRAVLNSAIDISPAAVCRKLPKKLSFEIQRLNRREPHRCVPLFKRGHICGSGCERGFLALGCGEKDQTRNGQQKQNKDTHRTGISLNYLMKTINQQRTTYAHQLEDAQVVPIVLFPTYRIHQGGENV